MEKKWHSERITFHKKIKEYLTLILFIACAALLSLVIMDSLIFPIAVFSVKKSALFTTLVKHSIPVILFIVILYKIFSAHHTYLKNNDRTPILLISIILESIFVAGFIIYTITAKTVLYSMVASYPIFTSIAVFLIYKIISKLYTLIKEKHSLLLIIKSFFVHSGYTVLTLLILLQVIVPIALLIYWIISKNYYQLDKITQ